MRWCQWQMRKFEAVLLVKSGVCVLRKKFSVRNYLKYWEIYECIENTFFFKREEGCYQLKWEIWGSGVNRGEAILGKTGVVLNSKCLNFFPKRGGMHSVVKLRTSHIMLINLEFFAAPLLSIFRCFMVFFSLHLSLLNVKNCVLTL
jgi:hypothetical protein